MVSRENLIIGLTGSFGSGCTSLREALEELGFKGYSLSDIVWEEWRNKNKSKNDKEAKRSELQDIGNELRKNKGNSFLAKEILKRAKADLGKNNAIVIESIRHTAEIEELRKYHNFFLIAVDCLRDERWKRVKTEYRQKGLTEYDFDEFDRRDKNEGDKPYGQQVQLCVDEADILMDNTEEVIDAKARTGYLKEKMQEYIPFFEGKAPRPPSSTESYMALAYTASLLSKCIKRQVGAVILDPKGKVVSIGYNENPPPMEPCFEKFRRCFRDIYKDQFFNDLASKDAICPYCHNKIEIVGDYHCKSCGRDLDEYFLRDKILSRCTALHAEERAILQGGTKILEGATLYTTTFPCFLCSKKILEAGIKKIVYAEPYPDSESAKVLKENDEIQLIKFEGVKARAYFRLFGPWRRVLEARLHT